MKKLLCILPLVLVLVLAWSSSPSDAQRWERPVPWIDTIKIEPASVDTDTTVVFSQPTRKMIIHHMGGTSSHYTDITFYFTYADTAVSKVFHIEGQSLTSVVIPIDGYGPAIDSVKVAPENGPTSTATTSIMAYTKAP